MGVSGGKDSLTLLYALAGLRKFYPQPFEIYAISVDLGYPGFDLSPVKELCERLAVPYTIVPTKIGEIITATGQESHPCSLCAKIGAALSTRRQRNSAAIKWLTPIIPTISWRL